MIDMNFRHLLGCDTIGPTCRPGVPSIQTEDPKKGINNTERKSKRMPPFTLHIPILTSFLTQD